MAKQNLLEITEKIVAHFSEERGLISSDEQGIILIEIASVFLDLAFKTRDINEAYSGMTLTKYYLDKALEVSRNGEVVLFLLEFYFSYYADNIEILTLANHLLDQTIFLAQRYQKDFNFADVQTHT